MTHPGFRMQPGIEEQVGQAINEVFLHLEDWTYEQLLEGFHAIEERFAWVGNSDPTAFREIQRRVAEDGLLAAQDKEQSIDECERRLQRVLELGWSDRYRAAEVLLTFGRYCAEHGRTDLARTHLAPVAQALEAQPPLPEEEELHANLLAAVHRQLRGL